MTITVNLNEDCYVILTETGAEILNNRQHPDEPKHKKGDIWECQLHQLIGMFGNDIYKKWDAPIFQNAIHFQSKI